MTRALSDPTAPPDISAEALFAALDKVVAETPLGSRRFEMSVSAVVPPPGAQAKSGTPNARVSTALPKPPKPSPEAAVQPVHRPSSSGASSPGAERPSAIRVPPVPVAPSSSPAVGRFIFSESANGSGWPSKDSTHAPPRASATPSTPPAQIDRQTFHPAPPVGVEDLHVPVFHWYRSEETTDLDPDLWPPEVGTGRGRRLVRITVAAVVGLATIQAPLFSRQNVPVRVPVRAGVSAPALGKAPPSPVTLPRERPGQSRHR